MNNSLLYLLTVFIWGSTWIGIKYQLGVVDPFVSIGHRFALAAVLVFLLLGLRRDWQRLALRDHGFLLLQAICLFSMNYACIYTATQDLTSGLVAVVFSTMVIINPLNATLLLGAPFSPAVLAGGVVGLAGMVGVFWPELEALDFSDRNFVALLICLAGTLLASLGNMVAARNTARGLPVLTCNAWGMAYGAVIVYLLALATGASITLDTSTAYLASLVYLAVFGSVLAFWAYVVLIGRIGPDRAAYTSLLFPVVALLISTLVEDYRWTWSAILGLTLVLLGNWLVMRRSASRTEAA